MEALCARVAKLEALTATASVTQPPDPVAAKAEELKTACRELAILVSWDSHVTEPAAAQLLGKAPTTLRNWRDQRRPLPFRKLGGGSSTILPTSRPISSTNRPKPPETHLPAGFRCGRHSETMSSRFRPCRSPKPFPWRLVARAAKLTALHGYSFSTNTAEARWGYDNPAARLLKAAVAPGTSTDSTWASMLTDPGAREVFTAIRERSIMGRLAGMRRVPPNTHLVQQTGSATASWAKEVVPKSVSKLTYANGRRSRS